LPGRGLARCILHAARCSPCATWPYETTSSGFDQGGRACRIVDPSPVDGDAPVSLSMRRFLLSVAAFVLPPRYRVRMVHLTEKPVELAVRAAPAWVSPRPEPHRRSWQTQELGVNNASGDCVDAAFSILRPPRPRVNQSTETARPALAAGSHACRSPWAVNSWVARRREFREFLPNRPKLHARADSIWRPGDFSAPAETSGVARILGQTRGKVAVSAKRREEPLGRGPLTPGAVNSLPDTQLPE
jgi:hypothetical protein